MLLIDNKESVSLFVNCKAYLTGGLTPKYVLYTALMAAKSDILLTYRHTVNTSDIPLPIPSTAPEEEKKQSVSNNKYTGYSDVYCDSTRLLFVLM